MKKIAFLFPGQGSQSVGMGKDLYNNFETAKKIYDTANTVLGKDIMKICFEGPEEDLKQTVNTQPAIVTTSLALLEVFKEAINIYPPNYTAGHSLGEYCAMYCAGVMSLENTFKAIQKRAEVMSEIKGGAMAAVLNASEETLKAGLEEGSKYGYVDVANYNSPVQVVITGDETAVQKAGEYYLANGVRRFIQLPVSGAFHSKYMEKAGDKFKEFLTGFELNNASIPVITNVDAEETTLAEDFRTKMPKQICSSVYWTQTIQRMVENGVDTFIEIGPGKVLAGLNKKIAPEATVYNIFDKESLESTINALREDLVEI